MDKGLLTPAGASLDLAAQLVTLDRAAAIVRLSKAALRRYVKQMPPPARPGVRGRPALWDWREVRPWLAATFGMPRLPERFPDGSDRPAEE
jgi:hypothetical protein